MTGPDRQNGLASPYAAPHIWRPPTVSNSCFFCAGASTFGDSAGDSTFGDALTSTFGAGFSCKGAKKAHKGMAHKGIFLGARIVEKTARIHRKSVVCDGPTAGNSP